MRRKQLGMTMPVRYFDSVARVPLVLEAYGGDMRRTPPRNSLRHAICGRDFPLGTRDRSLDLPLGCVACRHAAQGQEQPDGERSECDAEETKGEGNAKGGEAE